MADGASAPPRSSMHPRTSPSPFLQVFRMAMYHPSSPDPPTIARQKAADR
jgi:hypothetical protein